MDDESGESMELMDEMPLKELLSNFSADNRHLCPIHTTRRAYQRLGRLGRTSPKWHILCEVGRKTLHSSAKYTAAYYSLSKKIHFDGAGPLQRAPG